jgi:hypothetical protein
MNLCMAATYDPDPRAPNGFRIPFNAESGEVIEERWREWRRNDPINLVSRYRENLKSLRGIYIDCGWKDQYHIQYGSRILSQRLGGERFGIATKSLTMTTRTSTTGWTLACHFYLGSFTNTNCTQVELAFALPRFTSISLGN